MTPKRARLLGWVGFGLTLACIPVAALILVQPLRAELPWQAVWGTVVAFVGALAFSAVGALIVSQHPRHAIGWTFVLSGVATAGAVVLAGYAELSLAPGWSLPAGGVARAVSEVLIQSGIFLPLTLGLLLFPDGRFLSGRWWIAAAAAVLGLVLRLIGDATGSSSPNSAAFDLGDAGVLLTVASALAGMVALALRWQRASQLVRQQVKWMAAAAVVVVLAFIGDIVVNIWNHDVLSNDAEFLVFSLTYTLIPVAAGTAILRYGLYSIDFIINQAIVYIVFTAILAGVYTAFTATLQRVFVAVTGQSSDAAIVITVALIATLFTPVRNALQRLVDRRFKDARGLERLMQSLESEVGAVVDVMDGQRLAERLVKTAREGADATGAALFLDGETSPSYVSGDWTGQAVLVVPLRAGDHEVGRIALGARRRGAPYLERERERLQRAADVVAVGLTLGRQRRQAELVAN
jgi:GAF domain-containing protein